MARVRRFFWPLPALLGLLLCLAAGCRCNTDLIEAELREKECKLREVTEEMDRLRAYNEALQYQVNARVQPPPPGAAPLTPELASQTYTLTAITLARQTGGYDRDNVPGDEALQVVVEPRDPDGHTIKAPGTLMVQALEVTREGTKRPLSAWQLSPDELRATWKTGFLGAGYFVVLPWKAYPTSEKLRVVAQFVTPDGRTYEADKDVTVKLVPSAIQRVPAEEAPPPRKADPPQPAAGPDLTWRKAPPAAVEVLKVGPATPAP
jgi:hypothetical protein